MSVVFVATGRRKETINPFALSVSAPVVSKHGNNPTGITVDDIAVVVVVVIVLVELVIVAFLVVFILQVRRN